MSSPKTKALLLMSSALVAAVLLAQRSEAVAGRSDVLELLDPAAVAASACGLGGRQAGALRPGATQIALVSPADGVVAISPAQLGYLLEGIDWRHPQRSWRPARAG